MLTSTEFWISVGAILIVGGVVGRYVYAKVTGKEISNGDLDIVTKLRDAVITTVTAGKDLLALQQEQGTDAVRSEIAAQIKAAISNTDALTEAEKSLLESLDIEYVVELVEKQLIALGIIKSE